MAKPLRIAPTAAPILRVLLRRSKDETQEYSLDLQREGCLRFGESLLVRQPPVPWTAQREYVDDGIAGDDFLGRAGLRRLLDELRPGDAVVCRDHSRLGRDALEVTIAVREIVKNRTARLFYYASGQEVTFNTAIDAVTTFIQGVGAQMELEAIRSRTREALRARVRQGRLAGGRCYGYTNVRTTDASGRRYTVAVVNEQEARIVREIFERYRAGEGLKKIADWLNQSGVASPAAGRRGTGSWAPTAVREFLRRERYHGVYIHGQVDRLKQGGKRVARRAASEQVLRIEVPEWRIIDETTWHEVQAALAARTHEVSRPGPMPRYPLTGLARCGLCGGSITVGHGRITGRKNERAYVCSYYLKRGTAVCPMTVYQPIDEVHDALAEYVRRAVLTPDRVEKLLGDVRAAIEAETAEPTEDEIALLERELRDARVEQRKYVAAVAQAPDVADLALEVRKRNDLIKRLEARLATLRRTPALRADLLARIDSGVREKLTHLRATLDEAPANAREVYRVLFPDGLTFTPVEAPPSGPRPRGGRTRARVWAISATADLGGLLPPSVVTPSGLEPEIAA